FRRSLGFVLIQLPMAVRRISNQHSLERTGNGARDRFDIDTDGPTAVIPNGRRERTKKHVANSTGVVCNIPWADSASSGSGCEGTGGARRNDSASRAFLNR